MIDYYTINQENFDETAFDNENHIELIRCLINRLMVSNIRVVSDETNTTLKSLINSLKYIKSINKKKSIEKKIKNIFFRNKVRKSRFEKIDKLGEALSKYDLYSGEIVFDENKVEDNHNLLIERGNDHIYEDQQRQAEGLMFNELENNNPLVKIMLGSTFLKFGVFNFYDSIKEYHLRKCISESINFYLKIFFDANSEENNFFFKNNDAKKFIIYCSTKLKLKNFEDESKYKEEIYTNLVRYYKEELYPQEYINNFINEGGQMSVYIFPRIFEDEDNEEREQLHERFITTANGIFSLSKDIDLFRSKSGEFIPKKVKFGYHSDFHPFSRKAQDNKFVSQPYIVDLDEIEIQNNYQN